MRKKIIIPFAGDQFPESAFSFASELNSLTPILLAGVFLPEVEYASFFFFPTSFAAPAFVPIPEGVNEERLENNVKQFSESCEKNSIEYTIHRNSYDTASNELTKETRFADAMIMGGGNFFMEGEEYVTDRHLKDALHNTECPVIIVPEHYTFPGTIILAYDGSESSVYSIKQFAFLFPELCNSKTVLLHIQGKQKEIPDQPLIEELTCRHYSDITIIKLALGDEESISNWIKKNKNPMIVSGSFGRSGFSQFFRESFVMGVVKEGIAPVFIAHR